MKRFLLLVTIFFVLISLASNAQTQLAAWTFDGTANAPNTPSSFFATLGTQTSTAVLLADGNDGSSVWVRTTSGNELTTFGGTTINDPRGTPVAPNALAILNQAANGKSIVFKFSMSGFKDPILSFATQRTSTGFDTHLWEWSLDGIIYSSITTITSIPSAFAVETVNMSSVNALDGIGTVYVRLTVTGATSGSGNNRLDNIVITATPATPPLFITNYPRVQNISASSFEGVVKLDKTSTVYVTVQPDGMTTPTSAQVKAGQDGLGNTLASNLKSTVNVTSISSEFTFPISALSESTAYDVYFAAENTDGLSISPVKVDITTLSSSDVIPPAFTVNYPDVNNITSAALSIRTNITEAGKTYYVILPNNATSPSPAQVKAGTDAGNTPVTLKGTILNLSAGLEFIGNVTGLAPETSYDIYLAAEDNIPNLQASATKIDVTTTPLPYIEDFNTCLSDVSSFSRVSVSGVHVWDCTTFGNGSTNGVQINAGTSTGSTANEDWLISPQMSLTANSVLTFDNRKEFNGDDITLKIAVSYDGTNPLNTSWNNLTFTKSTGAWVSSGPIDLSAYAGLKAYVAIVYTSGSTVNTGARWTIDNFTVTNAVASYLVTSVNKVGDFGYVAFPNTSPEKTFTILGRGISNNLTATAPSSFELSKDGNTFSSSITYTAAEIATQKTVHVRFKPTAAGIGFLNSTIVFASDAFLKGIGVSGVEGVDPRASTLDVTTYNLEFFGTDVRDAGNVEFGPTNDALQVANVTTVLQTLGSDIYGVEEVADDAAFNQLVANMPGYAGILSPKWSYSFQAPDPNFPPQKVGFIYNTSTINIINSRPMFSKLYDDIQANTVTLPGYPGGTSSSFWSSGRLPFMITADVTIGGVTKRMIFIVIHSKSGSAADDYARRVYDVQVLHDSLTTNYPNNKIILMGDFNDDVLGSIYAGHDSSYKVFVDDTGNFNALTYDLTQTSAATFPSSGSFLDHIITSNELTTDYVANSIFIEDPSAYIASYSSTTSDHLPVTARFNVTKETQSITFDPLPNMSAGNPQVTLTGYASSGLPVTYTSSNPSVATVSGNVLTIVGAGSTIITASQAGTSGYFPASDVPQSLLVNIGNQTITFGTLPTMSYGDAPYTLTGTTSSGLTITYSSSDVNVATISGNTLTITGPGNVNITASQNGNANFNAATPVVQPLFVTFGSQTITFGTLPAKGFGDAPFALTATASSGLPVSYVSSNPSVATISGSTVTIVAQGTTTITASQPGNTKYNPAPVVNQPLVVGPMNQTITFATIPDKTIGDPAFAIAPTASSGLTVSVSTTSDKISINALQVTILKAGRASITASQAGNANVNAATPVVRSFCINPAKPIVTTANLGTEAPVLTSSATAGNQWFLNGAAISGATNATLTVTTPGVYKVQAKADDCVSVFSSDIPIIVTGDLRSASALKAFPNPAVEYIEISGLNGDIVASQTIDATGKTVSLTFEKNSEVYRGYVNHLASGVYIVRIQDNSTTHQIKFIRK